MERFILQENAKGFRARLAEAKDEQERRRLREMLAAVERELTLLEAAAAGVGARPWPVGAAAELEARQAAYIEDFRGQLGASPQVAYLIDPAPGLALVEVNRAFELATGMRRDEAVGQPLFLLFPDNPGQPGASGAAAIYASLRRVAGTGRPHAMPVTRYDVRDAAGGFAERYWRPVNAPLHDDHGRLIFLLHIVDEVTDEVLSARAAS